ncbi:MAG: peptidoglycan-binding protein, partial [Magnetospirillum sp.]|nr:peptidoglycan-binding protein [Magnetospirillum sp.]
MKRSLLPVALLASLAAGSAAAQWTKGGVPQQIGEAEIAPMRDVVLAVEQKLQQLGYRVTPDGSFDAELGNTVLAYQRDRGLRPTGN